MISITELENINQSDLDTLENDELYLIHGGGFTPLDTGLGALAGGIGGGLGQAAYNYNTNQPITNNLAGAIGINAAFGALNPVSGATSFGLGVVKAVSGSVAGAAITDTQPANAPAPKSSSTSSLLFF